ncbi:MAG: Transcriptional regulator, GntR family domain / Aspartate aminotransferase [Acidobacteria bacterium]|nr:Transcriptional regulator, GntR family domain / Aspartate aminotransferase [Acidobacteriota bacterium]
MARWEVSFTLERGPGVPLFQQIARAVSADIRRGRLRPGDALPGTRTLAHALGVQRLTVVAAFDELVAEGWIVNQRARGAFVSTDLPDPKPRRFTSWEPPVAMADRTGFDLLAAPEPERPYDVPRGSLLFAPSRPDVRLVPGKVIGRAFRRAMSQRAGTLLSYGPSQGHPRLRQSVSTMVASTRGLAAGPENVCITRGSQMALSLLSRALLRPGDVVAVEQLGYRSAWESFKVAGAKVIGVPVDRDGLQVDALERAIAQHDIRAVYVTPHHQFPTTVTMSAGRRLKLMELARTHRFAIIEDDYDHEFHYDGRPVLPLASADRFGVVIYVGTFSKVLAPALRLGYVVAPVPLIARIAAHRSLIDTQGDQVLEYAIAELLDDGEIQRHIRRVRREYHARRDTLVEALRSQLADDVTFAVPAGGIALWVRATKSADVDRWAARARDHGAVIVTAAAYALDGRPRPFMRLGFASLNSRELEEGVRRLAAARPIR